MGYYQATGELGCESIAGYNKLMSLSADYHDSKNSGTVWMTVRNSGYTVSTFVSSICFEIVSNVLDLAFGAIAFGSFCGAPLVGLMVLVLIVYGLVLAKASQKNSRSATEWSEARQKGDNITSDTLPNWWTAYFFGRLDYEKQRHAEAYNTKRSGADLVIFTFLWVSITTPAQNVLGWDDKVKNFSIEVGKLVEILRQEPTFTDLDGAKDITVEDVTFSYEEKRRPAVQNISFDAESGKTIAVVGQSGSGKSTLLKLLMRSYDTQSGSIRIDGQDIRVTRKATLLRQIGTVPQNIGVFDTSILENLRYAKSNATLAECEETCRAIGLHTKITTFFEHGYHETIGEKGGKLSGGELHIFFAKDLMSIDIELLLIETTGVDVKVFIKTTCVKIEVLIEGTGMQLEIIFKGVPFIELVEACVKISCLEIVAIIMTKIAAAVAGPGVAGIGRGRWRNWRPSSPSAFMEVVRLVPGDELGRFQIAATVAGPGFAAIDRGR
ncbi:hypothetical protein MMC13_003381 [Lambiella insularis]|nr:hypothetical protein [Lambiella insularis]